MLLTSPVIEVMGTLLLYYLVLVPNTGPFKPLKLLSAFFMLMRRPSGWGGTKFAIINWNFQTHTDFRGGSRVELGVQLPIVSGFICACGMVTFIKALSSGVQGS